MPTPAYGLEDGINSFTATLTSGSITNQGFSDVREYGSVDIVLTASVSQKYWIYVSWSTEGAAIATQEVFEGVIALDAALGYSLTLPTASSFLKVDVYNPTGNSTADVTVSTVLRPYKASQVLMGGGLAPATGSDALRFGGRAALVVTPSGIIDGRKVKTAMLDANTTNGNATVVAAITGRKIRVIGYSIQNAGTAQNLKWTDGAGGAALSGTHSLAGNAQQLEAASTGTFVFETTAGNALILNSGGTNAKSCRVTYIEV